MSTRHDIHPFEPGQRRELVHLVRRIQTLTLELQELEKREHNTSQLDAKQRRLEHLRWRQAAVAQRAALDDLGNAA
jgi:hypothetical protein